MDAGQGTPKQNSTDDDNTANETTPLIAREDEPVLYKTLSVYATISVLLLGVFISNIDSSLILATYGQISSEFNDFDSGSWLISGFVLASCVVQPLYGKLSDIYGRKVCLQTSYILFTLGNVGLWFGQTMGQVIAARVVQGAGAAGMTSMVSIIITDLVPIHEVASIRSYVNVLQTTGRSCGGVVGGALTQALGWRWAFGIQVPFTLIAILLVQWRLHITSRDTTEQTKWQKLRRIDFAGAILLCVSIFAGCFMLETGGQKFAWKSPIIIAMGVVFGVTTIAFVVSSRFAAEPIFPLRLFTHYAVWTNYVIGLLQILVQFSLTMVVPLYFQVTARASTAAAGAYLIPAFTGNTIGGLLSGYWIKSTGLYKPPTVLAPMLSIIAVTLCFTLWNGHTTVLESLAILPGGMAAGMVSSSTFVGLAAGVAEEDIAVAASGLYLFMNIGAIAGASAGSAVWQTSLRAGLATALEGVKNGHEIMRRALTDITYVQNASRKIRNLVVPAFIYSFHQVNLLQFVCVTLCLLAAFLSPQKRLKI
ncbi:hypothetical protein M409DRAFT_67928 [Zasmidium cellare ATCC 36951]|uniref:Major facilitator superfamily (MFS) profile domain-containing protein n=1 Tax=Zasmidium cellare ATCC 36951 TaxID=1080233 RepID=A0A6A6CBK6_ZASCE|nr:uncharacterized protein M409DRAFT_67928 [Zasmidium cellare ATCC 36951]KAF2164435.1 hypothetical protein M409DRAFT_67928 [Zasmidium cellare ATCC 36951]